MNSTRAKRIGFVIGLLFVVLLVCALIGAYMISHDPGFAFETPNAFEANRFKTKLQSYEKAVANGTQGFMRFSQAEINSYIGKSMTNLPADGSGMHLRRIGVGLSNTNLTLYSWGECKFLRMPLKFVLQRGYRIEQNGTNQWETPLESFRIGEVDVPKRFWDSASALVRPLDAPVLERFAWTTNIKAVLVRKNEVSERAELRLYTYSPIPAADLH